MKSIRAQTLLSNLDTTVSNILSFTNANELEKSYLAKFLVVFICGIYEEIIEIIINEMVSRTNSKEIIKYVNESMKEKFRSPNIDNICRTLTMFNTDWAKIIRKMLHNQKCAINSIKDNKDLIAHGLPCMITLGDVIKYYSDSKSIIEKIDELVL